MKIRSASGCRRFFTEPILRPGGQLRTVGLPPIRLCTGLRATFLRLARTFNRAPSSSCIHPLSRSGCLDFHPIEHVECRGGIAPPSGPWLSVRFLPARSLAACYGHDSGWEKPNCGGELDSPATDAERFTLTPTTSGAPSEALTAGEAQFAKARERIAGSRVCAYGVSTAL